MTEAQSVSAAVEQVKTGAMAVVDQSTGWFGSILPSHVEPRAFVGMAKAYLKKNARLRDFAERDPRGFMVALSECARLGLVPGDTFHVVPFENRKDGTIDFTPIVDYTGEIELIYNAGAVSSIKAEVVYSNDAFEFTPDMDRPHHVPNWFGERGEMVGVYAYAVMKDGSTSRVVVMSRTEVMKVKAVSKTADRSDSPWAKWEDRMWLKSCIHQLSKWVPTSAEYRREQLRAAVEADNLRTPAADVVEAEIVEGP